MKTFILRSCFFILFLTQFRVCVPSSSNFFLVKDDNPTSRGNFKEENYDTEDKEDFKSIRGFGGFGDIVDTEDEDESEDDFIEEIEEETEEGDEDGDMENFDTDPLEPQVDTSETSRKSGCSCRMDVCECFGESVKSIPKNMTSVSRL